MPIPHTYRVIGKIGAGNSGEIYKAYQINLGKYVVLKKIKTTCLKKISGWGSHRADGIRNSNRYRKSCKKDGGNCGIRDRE